MRIKTAYPVQSMDGKTARMSFFSTPQGTFTRERGTRTAVAATSDQKKIQTFVTLASRNWDDLTEAQRTAWNAYAAQYFPAKDAKGPVGAQGLATYIKACVTRQIMGLGLLTDAPSEAPPSPLTGVTVQPAANDQEIVLALTHGLAAVAGHSVLVEITPAMASVARTPTPAMARLVKGVDPGSAAALVVSGATVTFAGARYAIPDGKRFGVEVRVVRDADGMASTSVFQSALRSIL